MWPQVLQRITELGGGVLSVLFVVEPETRRLVRSAASAFPGRDAYLAHYGSLDPRNGYGMTQPAGTVFTDYDFTTEAEMAQSEFYQDYLLPQDMGYVGAKILKNDRRSVAAIAIQRARRQGPFKRSDLALLDRLAPHVLRALRLQARFADLEAQRSANRLLQNRLPFAVIVLDERLRIVELNRAAEQLLAAGDGLTARHHQLRATYPADRAALDRLIRDAVATAMGTSLKGGGIDPGASAIAAPGAERDRDAHRRMQGRPMDLIRRIK